MVYSGIISNEADLPRCYDTSGNSVPANYYGAAAGTISEDGQLGIGGDTCNATHNLICIEQ